MECLCHLLHVHSALLCPLLRQNLLQLLCETGSLLPVQPLPVQDFLYSHDHHFGVRPFLKGMVHALLFEEWLAQIWTLIGIEVGMVIVIILFEIVLDSHKSRLILFFELLYSFSLIGINVFLLLKHEYFADKSELKMEFEIDIKLLVYFMLILFVLRLMVEIKNALECKCNSSSVVPSKTIKSKKKKKKKKW